MSAVCLTIRGTAPPARSLSSPSLLVLTIANPILADAIVWFAIAQG